MRNGFYSRTMIDVRGEKRRLYIQRVRCRGCNAAHSQLYDFLIPYRQVEAKALEEAVRGYVQQPTSYLDGVTEAVKEPAQLFDAVKRFLERLALIWVSVAQMLIAAGVTVKELTEKWRCPNSGKSRVLGKRELLDWAAGVFSLVPSVNVICARLGISVFESGRGCGLLRTHRAECKPF